ncbi:MAG: hypothetical protein IJ721_07800 [Bacteroidales bacterium]|nr:hypothetical protein [Bacteroidales bacterium]
MTTVRKIYLFLAGILLTAVSCTKDDFALHPQRGGFTEGEPLPARGVTRETRKVLLLYSAGFNSLHSYLDQNLEELSTGFIPGKGRNDDVLLVFSHTTAGGYGVPTAPVLVRLSSDGEGTVVQDTLRRWPAGMPVTEGSVLRDVLTFVRQEFPARSYGMLYSSHATGWLPPGYFTNQAPYEGSNRGSGTIWSSPVLRSIGQEYYGDDLGGGTYASQEMSVREMVEAIPYRLDYILFDCCLMGCVEIAYELRNVCGQVGFSPTEILAKGFDYTTLTGHLLGDGDPDPLGVCQDYFARYADGKDGGATITLVDCAATAALAEACRPLFDRYRTEIQGLDGRLLQRYDRTGSGKAYYCFFDLKDILDQAGAAEEQLDAVQEALDGCILYLDHTDRFLSIPIERYCGLSMYLPARADGRADTYHGTPFLDRYYQENLSWNDATELVR